MHSSVHTRALDTMDLFVFHVLTRHHDGVWARSSNRLKATSLPELCGTDQDLQLIVVTKVC